MFASTPVFEIVQIECPNHGSTQFHGSHHFGFASDDTDVIESPLVAFVGIRTHCLFGILTPRPSTFLDSLADLVVSQKSSLSSKFASRSWSSSFSIESILIRIVQ